VRNTKKKSPRHSLGLQALLLSHIKASAQGGKAECTEMHATTITNCLRAYKTMLQKVSK
jgi:hypothetical protein